MQLLIDPAGSVRCLYTEAIPFEALGDALIRRGSYVEPDLKGRWFADLAPVAGPRLGPFVGRSQAVAAERQWLEAHWLVRSQVSPCAG